MMFLALDADLQSQIPEAMRALFKFKFLNSFPLSEIRWVNAIVPVQRRPLLNTYIQALKGRNIITQNITEKKKTFLWNFKNVD